MAAIEEILTAGLAGLPDYAQLGRRMFITDGRHCNKVIMDASGASRIMGAKEQLQPLDVSFAEDAAGPYSRGERVTYAVRRVVTARGLEINGGLQLEYYQIPYDSEADPAEDPAKVTCSIKIYPYEYSLEGVDSLKYEIYRSKAENAELLYLAATLTDEDLEGLTDNTYVDDVPWDEVPVNFTINLSSEGFELSIPPCSYVRAWRGALIMGGYRRRKVELTQVEGTEYTAALGDVDVDDIGCFVSCEDGEYTSQILGVSVGAESVTVTVDEEISGTGDCTLWRDDDVVYISRPMAGNIEAYSAERGRLITNAGGGNAITGIAANGTYAYIFRQNNVEILTGTPDAPSLEPFPGTPPGCRGHATIADRYSPYVIYYAGANGVWIISGSSAKRISGSIDNLIRNGIDHRQDDLCHAVYDPRMGYYWLFVFSKNWRANGLRMPDMLLLYDTITGSWTRGELYAGSSGLWRDAAGELVPVIGLPSGVARLDIGHTDGPVRVSGELGNAGEDWFELAAGYSGDLSQVVAGMPAMFGRYEEGVRRIVRSCVDGVVSIYGEMPDVPIGTAVQIGNIRWYAVTPEVGLSGYFDRALKLEAVSLAHGRSQDELPVKVRINGIGNLSDEPDDSQVWAGRMDFSERTISRLDGRATGLRAASMMMSFCGEHAPALVKAVRVDLQKVQR